LAGFERPCPPPFPAYLDQALVERNSLERRWASFHEAGPLRHPRRSDAVRVITRPFWPWYFESVDAAWTGTPVEEWHPFFSLPLVRYMMAVPELPYCVDKYLLRAYASRLLPREIWRRPKSPLRADPVAERMRNMIGLGTKGWALSHPYLLEFVDMKALAALATEGNEVNYARSRLFSLNLWLDSTFKGECQCPRKTSLRGPSTEPQFCGSMVTRRN
jgi:asparagine synthase (glutamine-hydrolysing)